MFQDKSSQLCRLCLKSGDCPIDIFDPQGTNGLLVCEIIKEFTEIETSRSDGLPRTICKDCMKKLTDFKYFKKMCINSRMEFLYHKINDGFVVPMTEDESGPSGGDLCGQGDGHTRSMWNNLEAEGIEYEVPIKMEEVDLNEQTENVSPDSIGESMENEHSELADVESQFHVKNEVNTEEIPLPEEYLSSSGEKVSSEEVRYSDVHGSASEMHVKHEEVAKEMHPLVEYTSTNNEESSVEEMQSSDANGSASEVISVECTDGLNVPVDGGGERSGNLEETLISEKGPNSLEGTGHQGSARKQHCVLLPVVTHTPSKKRRLRSNPRKENYGPDEGIESTPRNTSGKQFGDRNGEHTKRKEESRKETKPGNGALGVNISIGSSVGDEKLEGRDFICDGCGKLFRSKDLIEGHVKLPCGSEHVDCGIRSTKFHNRSAYRRHRSLLCGSNVSRRRVQRGVAVDVRGESEGKRQIEKRNPPTCHICKKNFSQRSYLNVHIKTVHLMERNFSCEICGMEFGQKGTLQSHMRSHSGVKPYTCSHCQKGFTESWNLRMHIRAVHEMEKPHTCGECGKAFSYKQHLKTHILLHTGERPHTCGICSKTFTQKHTLKSHMLIHTGEKPHTCTLCSKTFRKNDTLKRHMASHARQVPHPCNLCTKTFVMRSELQRHLAKHRGEDD